MLRLSLFIIFMLLLGVYNAKAQYDTDVVEPTIEANGTNNWYIELGGAALLWSANYEKYLFQNYNKSVTWTGRIGFGFSPIENKLLNSVEIQKNAVTMPFTTSLIFGKRKEKLEIGAGYSLSTTNFTEREVFPTALLGFRVIDNNKVLLRVAYTPVFRNEDFINWFGVSLGRNF